MLSAGYRWVVWLLLALAVSGCIFSNEAQQARTAAEKFWQAVFKGDMEVAKDLATVESVAFLQFVSQQNLAAQRFELGEVKVDGSTAEVATVFYSGNKADIVVPLRTALVHSEQHGWQVDVQKTMGSMVGGAMGAVAQQLEQFMGQGLQELDKALADSVKELNKHLQQGLEQLQKDLQVPAPPPVSPAPPAPGQERI